MLVLSKTVNCSFLSYNKRVNETYKYFGLMSVVMLIVGLIVVVSKWPKGVGATFSQHVAQYKSSIIYYQLLFLATLPFLIFYMLGWLEPKYSLGYWFSAFIIGSSVLQVACTFVPETGGTRTTIHRALAFLSADLLLPVVLIMVFNQELSIYSRIVSAVSLLGMLSVVGILLPLKGRHSKVLIMQSIYFALFFVAVLSPIF